MKSVTKWLLPAFAVVLVMGAGSVAAFSFVHGQAAGTPASSVSIGSCQGCTVQASPGGSLGSAGTQTFGSAAVHNSEESFDGGIAAQQNHIMDSNGGFFIGPKQAAAVTFGAGSTSTIQNLIANDGNAKTCHLGQFQVTGTNGNGSWHFSIATSTSATAFTQSGTWGGLWATTTVATTTTGIFRNTDTTKDFTVSASSSESAHFVNIMFEAGGNNSHKQGNASSTPFVNGAAATLYLLCHDQ